MKARGFVLMLLGSLLLAGCPDKPAPPPDVGPVVPLNVTVLRGANDKFLPLEDRMGYVYNDDIIRQLVNDFIARSHILTGQQANFVWDGFIHELSLGASTDHVWNSYTWWVSALFARPSPYREPSQINLFFTPGIIDVSDPYAFMDSFTLDPAHNNEAFWDTHDWTPMVLISDCWVWPGVQEFVRHRDEGPGPGMIWPSHHRDHLLIHHALGRYLLRHTDDGPLWDAQENWQGALPNYMKRWSWRVENEESHDTAGVSQGEVLERILSGNWNNP